MALARQVEIAATPPFMLQVWNSTRPDMIEAFYVPEDRTGRLLSANEAARFLEQHGQPR
jgi:hypothetical protein